MAHHPRDGPVELQRGSNCRLLLLAEDGPDNQRLIATCLGKAGASTSTIVENGEHAIDAAMAARMTRTTPFDAS